MLVALPIRFQLRFAPDAPIRWLCVDGYAFSRQRRRESDAGAFGNEILDASNGLGVSVKRREDMHKMAEANRAFASLPLAIRDFLV